MSGWRLQGRLCTGRWWNYGRFQKVPFQDWDCLPVTKLIIFTEFGDPAPPHQELSKSLSPVIDTPQAQCLVPDDNLGTLIEWAVLILNTPDPDLKVT